MTGDSGPRNADHPLRMPAFRRLLIGRTSSTLSDSMMPVALSLAIIKITGSAEDLAMVLLCAIGTRLALLPLAGVLVDRYNVRPPVMFGDLVRCGVQAFVAAQLLTGHPSIAAIAGAETLYGAASAISLCGLSPLVVGVTSRDLRQKANALMSAGRSLAQLLGPVLAGVLVVTVGAGWVFVLDSAAFAMGSATLAVTRVTCVPAARRSIRQDLMVGWSEVRRRDWYWSSLIAHAMVNFADTVLITLGPLVAYRHHGGQAIWAAVIEASGAGLFLGSICSARYKPRRPILAGNMVLASCAVPLLMFALWVPAPLLVASNGLSWTAMGFLNPIWGTTVQTLIPADVLARVSSYDWLASLATQPVALVYAPVVAAAWGVGVPLVGAAALVALAATGTALVPGVRNLRLPGPPASVVIPHLIDTKEQR